MDETELDKSEQATPFKLQRAREKGTIARGLDLGFFTALTAFIAYAWLSGASAVAEIARSSALTLADAGRSTGSDYGLIARGAQLFSSATMPLFVFGCTVFAVVLLFEFLQVGPVFTFHPLKPDFSRINPAKGLKRLFSWRMLVEAFKSVVKLGIYSTIAWLVISTTLENSLQGLTDANRLMHSLGDLGFKMLLFSALAALFIAAIDQIYSRSEFARKMRMSHRELKREHKDREGDPRQKQKRKEFHAAFAKAAKSLRGARGSDVILTNPTRYAVALCYDPATMQAPRIVSAGAGMIAHRIRDIGFTYGIIVIQTPELTRGLFRKGKIDGEIPEQFYEDVANIYRNFDLLNRKRS